MVDPRILRDEARAIDRKELRPRMSRSITSR